MVRTVISLTDEDKEWLDQRAQQIGVPMTERSAEPSHCFVPRFARRNRQ